MKNTENLYQEDFAPAYIAADAKVDKSIIARVRKCTVKYIAKAIGANVTIGKGRLSVIPFLWKV